MTADRRPRVLFVGLSAAGHGGIQSFNRRVIAALEQLDVPATVLMLADAETNGEVSGFGGGKLSLSETVFLRSAGAEVLLLGHINLLPFALLYRLRHPRGRVIMFAHGIEVWGDPDYRAARRWEPALLRRVVDRIAIVSRYSRDRMARAFGLEADRFTLFPNAVDVRPLVSSEPTASTILAVSRLGAGEREKHVDKLIRALPSVISAIPDARLVVIGEGQLRGQLQELAVALEVSAHVALPGAVSREALDRAYAEASVFALPSAKEGFGIVYLEAWTTGLPVIGANRGAAAEVIEDGVDGFTIDPEDVPALANALIALLGDRARAAAMGAAGRAKVERLYSGEAFVANLGALLTDVARDRRTLR
ncbi:glycosyltransferase family 4 protein [Sphingomonas radiodurans]|uniref:glycosyltransferase family 4 protein n=1 Tax=Sphingomonas radiodurans TaxID=2890321 RepID=UPI001E48469C|nr:glycosyltransferase family 4 protein [Sphingomonas radiodurans]WBH17911.1 glycosyltransferase family 4 protein [Sphingomonas radiodurans]